MSSDPARHETARHETTRHGADAADTHGAAPEVMDATFWDERYGSRDQLFSGAPNGVLVTEVGDLSPHHSPLRAPLSAPLSALDVGCGEGGDALWLASQGWHVTATDISRVALARAAEAADRLGAPVGALVTWDHADLTRTTPPSAAFALVNVQYFPLPRTPGHESLHGLLDAVAPGGTLLFVGHDLSEVPPQPAGVDPHDYYQPHEIAQFLGDGWVIEVDETRARTAPAPVGTHHSHDAVLRARRRA